MKQSLFTGKKIKPPKRSNKIWIIVGDIETGAVKDEAHLERIQAGETNFSLGGYMKLNNKTDKPDFETVHPQGMLNYLKILAQEAHKLKIRKIIVFFHNLTFDGYYFKKLFAEERITQTIESKRKMNNDTYYIYEETGLKNRILWMDVKFKNSVKIEFWCSYYLMGMLPLAELGKLIGYQKLEWNHNNNKRYSSLYLLKKLDSKFYQYWVRDLVVLKKVLKDVRLKNIYQHKKKMKQRFQKRTASSVTFHKLLEQTKIDLTDWKQEMLADDDYLVGQASYHGAVTLRKYYFEGTVLELFKTYENIYHADIKSSYPWRMFQHIPTKRKHGYLKTGERTPCFNKKCVHLIKIKVWNGILKKDMPTGVHHQKWNILELPKIINHEYSYHKDVFNTDQKNAQILWEWEPEWKLKATCYQNIQWKELNFIHFKVEKVPGISKFIMKQYRNKQQYKGVNQILYNSAKANLNGCYGHLCTSHKYTLKVPCYIKAVSTGNNNFKWVTNNDRKWTIPKGMPIYTNYKQEKFVYINKEYSDKTRIKDIFIGSWITSQARISVIKLIIANKNSFLYADTDSIFCSKKIIYPAGEQVGDQLGDWEEDEIDCFKYMNKSKQYIQIINDVVQCKMAGGAKKKMTTWLQLLKNQGHHNLCIASHFNTFNLKHIELYKVRKFLGGNVFVKNKDSIKNLPIKCIC